MGLKPEISLTVGLATATVVYAIQSNAMPSMADVRSLDPDNQDIEATGRTADWMAAGTVAAISLLAKDMTVFIIGSGMVIASSWWRKHSNLVMPMTGRATGNDQTVADATPATTQSEAPELYGASAAPAYDSTI